MTIVPCNTKPANIFTSKLKAVTYKAHYNKIERVRAYVSHSIKMIAQIFVKTYVPFVRQLDEKHFIDRISDDLFTDQNSRRKYKQKIFSVRPNLIRIVLTR